MTASTVGVAPGFHNKEPSYPLALLSKKGPATQEWAPFHPTILAYVPLSNISMQVNAAPIGDQPLGNFLHVAGMLVPLYSSRAAELAFFGPDGVSLASAAPLSDCFQIG
eukprot:1160443-Pelagomonas_calceolata.AAC.12